jgi:VCBS repeat-containing protein
VDPAALAAAFIAASVGQFQLAVAGKLLALSLDADRSAVQLIDAAQQNSDRLANVSAGIGTNLDVTV